MPSSRALVTTGHASRYLQQLCKHFAHKVTVEFDPHRGKVEFPFGGCRMWADQETLHSECAAGSDEELRRTQFVIDDHLVRFAWREKPEVAWQVTNG